MERAHYIEEPRGFVRHTRQRSFIGPGTIRLGDGSILMAAPWGRPPANFEQLAAKYPTPMLYRSHDAGRTWQEQGRMQMEWNLTGMISDGGITFLRLQDGRLAFLSHRHVDGLHGGGLPVFSLSDDEGETWTPARTTGDPRAAAKLGEDGEGVWYVMNDRMIQMTSGRLVVPVSHMPQGMGVYEGDRNLGLCLFSDDGGESWGDPVLVDEAGALLRDRQNIYPSVCFTDEGMLVVYSTHVADPGGTFTGSYSHECPDCGGKRAILAYPQQDVTSVRQAAST